MRSIRPIYLFLNDNQGKGALGCLLSILLLAVGTFVVVQVGPPYFAYKSLEGDVTTEVSRAGAHFFSDETLIQNILDVAKKNETPLKRENIKLTRLAGQVQVLIQYKVPVDLFLFQHVFQFDIKASSFVGAL